MTRLRTGLCLLPSPGSTLVDVGYLVRSGKDSIFEEVVHRDPSTPSSVAVSTGGKDTRDGMEMVREEGEDGKEERFGKKIDKDGNGKKLLTSRELKY